MAGPVIGIVSAIMVQYPEYFYTMTPGAGDPSLKAAKAIVIPLVITIIIWLIGKLAVSMSLQVLAKVVAWVFVTDITVINYYSYMQGLIWASGYNYVQMGLNDFFVLLGLLLFFVIGPVLAYFVVVPKYRQIYPNSLFLKSKTKLLIALIIVQACVFGLAVTVVS